MKTQADIIIFDLDGTLVDSSKDMAWAVDRTFEEIGIEKQSFEKIKSAIGWGVTNFIKELVPQITPEDLDHGRRTFLRIYGERIHVDTHYYDGVEELLEKFLSEGKKLAIATNKHIGMTEDLLQSMGERHKFSIVLGADSVENRKPHPEAPLRIIKELGGDPRRTVFVGDSSLDMASGKGAGTVTVGAVYGYRGREDLEGASPDYLIDSFSELRGIIA